MLRCSSHQRAQTAPSKLPEQLLLAALSIKCRSGDQERELKSLNKLFMDYLWNLRIRKQKGKKKKRKSQVPGEFSKVSVHRFSLCIAHSALSQELSVRRCKVATAAGDIGTIRRLSVTAIVLDGS